MTLAPIILACALVNFCHNQMPSFMGMEVLLLVRPSMFPTRDNMELAFAQPF